MAQHESICFNCKRALNSEKFNCPWSSEFKPVEGWVVEPGRTYVINEKKTVGYCVRSCPLYIRDKKYFELKDIMVLLQNKYGISDTDFYKRRNKYIDMYEKETGEILPCWARKESEEEGEF